LVEAMATGIPIIAHDNIFNRTTTDNLAFYFKDTHEILNHISNLDTPNYSQSGMQLKELAQRKYRWGYVSDKLIELIRRRNVNNT
jgi:glycosyltransferase involved in cell wall biosynthesis